MWKKGFLWFINTPISASKVFISIRFFLNFYLKSDREFSSVYWQNSRVIKKKFNIIGWMHIWPGQFTRWISGREGIYKKMLDHTKRDAERCRYRVCANLDSFWDLSETNGHCSCVKPLPELLFPEPTTYGKAPLAHRRRKAQKRLRIERERESEVWRSEWRFWVVDECYRSRRASEPNPLRDSPSSPTGPDPFGWSAKRLSVFSGFDTNISRAPKFDLQSLVLETKKSRFRFFI